MLYQSCHEILQIHESFEKIRIDEESETVVLLLNFVKCKLLVVFRKMHDLIQLRRLCHNNINVFILRACYFLNNCIIDFEIFYCDNININQNANDKTNVFLENNFNDLSFKNLKNLSIILR